MIFAVFSFGGLAAAVWGVLANFPGLVISGLATALLFAWMMLQVWSPSLFLDDVGVTWRIRPWNTGRLRWHEIADVKTASRYTEIGGGVTKYSAELIRIDGQSVLVARGTATMPWREDEMSEFGDLVKKHLADLQNSP